MMSKLTALVFAAIFIISPAFAADVNQPGADALKAALNKKLGEQAKMTSARGDKLSFEGDIKVAPKNDYYAVTFPDLKISDNKGQIINVGTITMNMAPTDTANQFKSSVSLPSVIDIVDAKDQPTGQIKLGTQKASGLFDIGAFSFTQLDASYSSATYSYIQSKIDVMLNDVSLDYDLTKTGDVYSGPAQLKTGTVSMSSAGNLIPLADKIDADGTMQITTSGSKAFTQKSRAEITGMSKALTAINSRLKAPDEVNKPLLQQVMGFLSIAQLSGKPKSGNPDTRIYNLETTADGKTLLNGVDISLMMSGSRLR